MKLGWTNFIIRKTQVLPAIRGNGQNGFMDGTKSSPNKHLVSVDDHDTVITTENPANLIWRRQNQLLLSIIYHVL